MDLAQLTASAIVPDVLPEAAVADVKPVNATWEHMSAHPLALPPGFSPLGTAKAPKLTSPATEAGKFYTVIITDPVRRFVAWRLACCSHLTTPPPPLCLLLLSPSLFPPGRSVALRAVVPGVSPRQPRKCAG